MKKMFCFDGQAKQRPAQSYGRVDTHGKMTSDETKQLAARERQKREDLKKQIYNATVIQSVFRSFRDRKRKKIELRSEFDCELKTSSSSPSPLLKSDLTADAELQVVVSLSRKLVFFYDVSLTEDHSRLVSLCQRIIRSKAIKSIMTSSILTSQSSASTDLQVSVSNQVEKLLAVNCRFVQSHSKGNFAGFAGGGNPLAIPLRMLEIFADPNVLCGRIGGSEKEMQNKVAAFLTKSGYFRTIAVLLETAVPPTLLHTESIVKIPMATTVLDLTRRFLENDQGWGSAVYAKLVEELFCRPLSVQMVNFFLPRLSTSNFPYVSLLDSLSRQPSLMEMMSPSQSLNLLYCVLILGVPHYGSFQSPELAYFLRVVGHLAGCLEQANPPVSLILKAKDDDDDDEDDDSDDDFEPPTSFASPVGFAHPTSANVKKTEGDVDDPMGEEVDVDVDAEEEEMKMDFSCPAEATNEILEKKLRKKCLSLLGCNTDLARRLMSQMNSAAVSSGGHIVECRDILQMLSKICFILIGSNRYLAMQKYRILSVLGCSSIFIEKLWELMLSMHVTANASNTKSQLLVLLSRGSKFTDEDFNLLMPVLSTFCNMFSYYLQTLTDNEFIGTAATKGKLFGDSNSMSRVALTLKDCCLGLIELTHPDTRVTTPTSSSSVPNPAVRLDVLLRVLRCTVTLVRQLYERDCRIKFCPEGSWASQSVESLVPKMHISIGHRTGELSIWNSSDPDVREARSNLSTPEIRRLVLLHELPFVIKFDERVRIFRDLLKKPPSANRFIPIQSSNTIRIRRQYLYEDAFEHLDEKNVPDLKGRVHFALISKLGTPEVGIDGGGIFRDTVREILKAGFDPNLGFFEMTSDRLLHPNHLAKHLNADYLQHFYFLGRILGKAIYSKLLIDLPFASFFLSKLLSRESSSLDIHYLASLDPELYKNLVYVRNYDGNVNELNLVFAVSYEILGKVETVDLKPNGRDIQVDNGNRFEYIHLMADYYLNKRIRPHYNAFRQGLANVVEIQWLRMFDHNELQYIISGDDQPIDLDDLKSFVNYSGGYSDDHEVIKIFWEVVEEFTEVQRRELLKFVTCSPKAPLYGFRELTPRFCIHSAGNELERLPTASTCMNQLKLPAFKDKKTMREKLLYAISAQAGFELS